MILYEHRKIWPLFFGKTVIYQCGCGTEASLVVKGKVCIRVPRRGKKYFYIFWLKRTETPMREGCSLSRITKRIEREETIGYVEKVE